MWVVTDNTHQQDHWICCNPLIFHLFLHSTAPVEVCVQSAVCGAVSVGVCPLWSGSFFLLSLCPLSRTIKLFFSLSLIPTDYTYTRPRSHTLLVLTSSLSHSTPHDYHYHYHYYYYYHFTTTLFSSPPIAHSPLVATSPFFDVLFSHSTSATLLASLEQRCDSPSLSHPLFLTIDRGSDPLSFASPLCT